jgi:hypothetical protein
LGEDHNESYDKWRAFYLEREGKREKHALDEHTLQTMSDMRKEHDRQEEIEGLESLREEEPSFCNYCGSQIPRDSVFCETCGKKLNQSSTLEFSNSKICDHSDKTFRESICWTEDGKAKLLRCTKCGTLFLVNIHDDAELFSEAFADSGCSTDDDMGDHDWHDY